MTSNKKLMLGAGLVAILLLIGFLHLAPERSLRAHLTMMGFPQAAWQADILLVEPEISQYASLEPNETLYEVSPAPIEKATEGELRYFAVEKVGIFYFPYFVGNF